MTSGHVPQPLRRLGLALRGLRLDAGLTGQQLAGQAGLSQSTVSRIELGQATPSLADIDGWARVTGASAQQARELRTLAEAAAVETISWSKATRRGLPQLQQDVRELEATSATILNFQPTIVPGLLQTAGYARALVASGYPGGRPDVAAAVTARLDRQAILYDDARHLEFVIAEAALRWRLGPPQLMLAQLDRVASVATLPSVTIGIIPQAAEVAAWHIHGFALLDDRSDGSPLVRVETLTTGLSISDPDSVDRYRQAFRILREAAAFDDEAGVLIRALMAHLRKPP
ncbi:MAG TPA: helix-turn-helix transcriptional regulator [Streptosporangiaceae bacterium]